MSPESLSRISNATPPVSVVVANYNGSKYIRRYMKSLFETDYANFEIVFVDDGSTDDSLAVLKDNFGMDPRLRIVRHEANSGLAIARNTGIRASQGEIVAFLDTDIEVDRNWLRALVSCLSQDEKIAVAMSKTMDMYDRDRIQCVGQILIPHLGWTFLRGYGETDKGQYDHSTDVFACLNAAAVKKSAFYKVGMIDEHMTYLWEDLDFEWRILVHGMKEALAPDSLVYHLSKAPKRRSSMYNWNLASADFFSRDIIRFFGKNYETKNVIRFLATSAFISAFRLFLALKRQDLSVPFGMVGSFGRQLKLFRNTISERHRVQRLVRRVPDVAILNRFAINGSLLHIYREHRRILSAADGFFRKSVIDGKRDLD